MAPRCVICVRWKLGEEDIIEIEDCFYDPQSLLTIDAHEAVRPDH